MGRNYGKIEWLESFVTAPQEVEYIVRELEDNKYIRFERYVGLQYPITLKVFPPGSLEKQHIVDTLNKCRKIMGCDDILWVEMPKWKFRERYPESHNF